MTLEEIQVKLDEMELIMICQEFEKLKFKGVKENIRLNILNNLSRYIDN